MATNIITKQKLEHLQEEDGVEEEEEEALSLCDLPVNVKDLEEEANSKAKQDSEVTETQDEFDFRSPGGDFFKGSEMCVADEVFFQGQILPLNLSSTVTRPCPQRDASQLKRCESRSESFGNGSLSEFRSNSSRSNSSTSSSTATTASRIRDQFLAHSSPQPQSKVTTPNTGISQGRKSSSSWEYLRLGVMPAPEVGLQDLKTRGNNKNSVSNPNSDVNADKNGKSRFNGTNHRVKILRRVFKQFIGKGGGSWSGCKCSVETVQSGRVMIKGDAKSGNMTESTITHAMKGKVVELKRQRQREKLEKRTMSRRRTFEWIKELSNASYPDQEALLSNNS